jgi:hypothetical protein
MEWTKGRTPVRTTETLASVLAHHATAHFPSGLSLFALPFDGRWLIVLPAFDFLHNAVALTFALESTQSLFDGLPVTNFNENHKNEHHLPDRDESKSVLTRPPAPDEK